MISTEVLPASEAALQKAALLLRGGQLVAFPTETVYGLGANALDREAVLSIFQAKGRPADNPLIVHIHDRAQLSALCEVPEAAIPLMDAFWPGPLTLLFPKKETVPAEVTAGLETVAIRMPSHPVALALLKAAGVPVAAPSANLSGKPSPTTAAWTLQDLRGRIPMILDGGSCEVGVESTVLDLCHGEPTILRPGGVTAEMLEKVLGKKVRLAGSILRPLQPNEKALSPGMRYKHYAPSGTVTLVQGDEEAVLHTMKALCAEAVADGKSACVLCFSEHTAALSAYHPYDIGPRGNEAVFAHRLFDLLRQTEEDGFELVFSEVVPPEGVGLAVMNRLGRAAAFRTVDAGAFFREKEEKPC